MTDYRDSNDPMYGYEPADRTGMSWGWIAGAVFLVIILAVAFGVGHEPTRVASNNTTPQTTAPAAPLTMPGLTPPPSQAPNRP